MKLKYYFLIIRGDTVPFRWCHSYERAKQIREHIKNETDNSFDIVICKIKGQNDGLYDTKPYKP